MEKEFLKETVHSYTLNVTAGRIDSFREVEKTTGTVRVYENGCIGIAGCLGEPNEEELTEKAKEALAFGIPYPCALEGPLEIEELHDGEIIPVPEFIPTMQAFLDRLGELCPRFAFSNKISLNYSRSEYRNSLGRRLLSSGRQLSIQLIVQSRGSGNLFDTGFIWVGDRFDADELLAVFKEQYDAFYNEADIEPGRLPVVFEPGAVFGSFFPHFLDDLYAAGASLVSGKLGEKLFSDKLTFMDDMDHDTAPGTRFFDAEGCVAKDHRPTLIKNGVLTGVLTTKKSAAQYGLPNLGTADAAYDGVPSQGFHAFRLDKTAETIGELVPEKAVLIIVASGGDTTPEGHYATPVQMAYLMEHGKLKGRLPQIAVSGEFFDILGDDYIGCVHDYPTKNAVLCAAMMNVDKI